MFEGDLSVEGVRVSWGEAEDDGLDGTNGVPCGGGVTWGESVEGDVAVGVEGDAGVGVEGDAAVGVEGDAAVGVEGDAASGDRGDGDLVLFSPRQVELNWGVPGSGPGPSPSSTGPVIWIIGGCRGSGSNTSSTRNTSTCDGKS